MHPPSLSTYTFVLCSLSYLQCSSAVHAMNYIVADGRSNWMERLILICTPLHPRILALRSWLTAIRTQVVTLSLESDGF